MFQLGKIAGLWRAGALHLAISVKRTNSYRFFGLNSYAAGLTSIEQTPTAIVGLYNWFGQTYIFGRLSLVHISLFLPRPAYNPNDNPFGYGFPS